MEEGEFLPVEVGTTDLIPSSSDTQRMSTGESPELELTIDNNLRPQHVETNLGFHNETIINKSDKIPMGSFGPFPSNDSSHAPTCK